MIINVVVYLKYKIYTLEFYEKDEQELRLIVKFKEPGKLFKRKLVKTLVSTWRIRSGFDLYKKYDEYYAEVEKYLNDINLIKMEAEEVVKNYFDGLRKTNKRDQRARNILNKINKMDKIEVKVEIK